MYYDTLNNKYRTKQMKNFMTFDTITSLRRNKISLQALSVCIRSTK